MSVPVRDPPGASRPLTVSALNRLAKEALEARFPAVWVTGEVSRPNHYPSGHVYFGLKDTDGRIDAVLFAGRARLLRFPLTEGLSVNIRGQLSIYPQQGRYQLICESVEPAGEGALRAAFLRLKAKLDAEGLTSPERKRPLPFLPRAVALVTSPQGAAIQDLTQTIWRRFPRMRIVFCPVRVQGDGAPAEIAAGLARVNARDDVDVIVVGRGGGSVEDLWTFNDEGLARAIAASRLPVVSAVGHEIDFTISDFVADVRALTPTEAGERVVPVLAELERGLAEVRGRLAAGARRAGREARQRIETLARRAGLRHFPRRFDDERLGLDLLHRRLRLALDQVRSRTSARLEALGRTLAACSPEASVREWRAGLAGLGARLEQAGWLAVDRARHLVAPVGRALEALNPLAVLGRGFTVTTVEREGRPAIVRSAAGLREGEAFRTVFARGPDLAAEARTPAPRTLPEAGG